MNAEVRTPENSPDDLVVGHLFAGYSVKTERSEVYLCDSYDPTQGYWLTNVNDPEDRKNVSERAIGRTFWHAEERSIGWFVPQWGGIIPKSKRVKFNPFPEKSLTQD